MRARSTASLLAVTAVVVAGAPACVAPPAFACAAATDCALDEACVAGLCTPGSDVDARDAGAQDAGALEDAGAPEDAGTGDDAGAPEDAGAERVDAGVAPASCADARAGGLPSGPTEIVVDGAAQTVECDMETEGGGWTLALRYVEGDACPGEWVEAPVRGCARPASPSGSSAAVLAAPPHAYTEVRGAVRALGFGGSDAFRDGAAATIDGVYVDGVTITAGTPRAHVFTFAHGLGEDFPGVTSTGNAHNCPCAGGQPAPAFVGTAFACEEPRDVIDGTGARAWDVVDPLWDGALVDDATCVDHPESAAAFRVVRAPSSDVLEVRAQSSDPSANEDTAVIFVELWVR